MFNPKVPSIPSTEQLEHERLTSLVNSMADGVLAVDAQMQVVLSNGAALNILDVNSSLKGKRLRDILRIVDKNNQPVDVEHYVSQTTTSITNRDLRLAYSDKSTISLYLSIAPVHLGYGKEGHSGFVLLLRDITREKSLEEERDEFISVVSHELRTPITIAEGNIANVQFLLSKPNVGPQMLKDALEQAHEQVVFLADMINDLATLSRAERGKLTMQIEHINVAVLIHELEAAFRPQLAEKHVTLSVSCPKDLTLQSSTLYTREILHNFMTNALKYTEVGGVTLKAEATSKGVRFTVADTGIGISRGDQDKLFDKFFRSEDFRTRKTNGTGLGLYVTLKLARLLHAEIDVKSELNKGSTFTIFIPNLK